MDCSICYDAITQSTGKVELSCSHMYHFSCLTSWFATQGSNDIAQSCPCCRHESNEHEMMKVPSLLVDDDDTEEDEDDDESEWEEMTEQELIDEAAAKERASMRFAKKKTEMTKEAFEAYAASKIAALYRGFCARFIVDDILLIKNDILLIKKNIHDNSVEICKRKQNVRMRKISLVFNMKALTMPYPVWRTMAATMIQKAWRTTWQEKKTHAVTIHGASLTVQLL